MCSYNALLHGVLPQAPRVPDRLHVLLIEVSQQELPMLPEPREPARTQTQTRKSNDLGCATMSQGHALEPRALGADSRDVSMPEATWIAGPGSCRLRFTGRAARLLYYAASSENGASLCCQVHAALSG